MGIGGLRVPADRRKVEVRWRGIAAAPGVALGPAYVYRVAAAEPPLRRLLPGADKKREYERFEKALAAVGHDLEGMRDEAPGSVSSAMSKIFDAQLLIVEDTTIKADVRDLIVEEGLSAESAFARVVSGAQDSIINASDPYLREMANEVQVVKRRVINRLLGLPDKPRRSLNRPAILLAHTITPADIMSLRQDHVLGVVSETGGQTSHTALLAKSLGIPAVVGTGHDVRTIRPGTQIVVNGYSGIVIVEPDAHTVEFMERKRKSAQSPWPKRLDALKDLPAETTDRHRIDLMANIDLAGEVGLCVAAGADGVGLYRTEYLFLQRGGYPSEARQRAIYRRAVEGLAGRPLVLRTFDLGSDKVNPESPAEANPALGVRGLRISLQRPKTLATQFRAILAASVLGPIRVMVPMVSSVDEFVAARREWKKTIAEMRKKGVEFDAEVPFGLMIETPASVYLAAELAGEADFLSIGSNDLIQYTTAVDRASTRLNHLANNWHPALWRQIASVVAAGKKHDTPVGVCGEMASDPLTVPALIGLELTSISAQPNSIPKIKSLIRSITFTAARDLAQEVLELKTATAVQSLLKDFNRKIMIRNTRRRHARPR
jgi:phosphotransferase system enzyme I (PtsI)